MRWSAAVLFAFAMALLAVADASDGGAAGARSGREPIGDPPAASSKPATASQLKPVDINSASRAELKTLPGIGDAEADRIIAGRPYLSKAELVSRNVMPEGVYISLRKQLIARQTGQPVTRQ